MAADPMQEIIDPKGMSGLWVFGRPYIFGIIGW